jgi:MOSC domain-containing protein YiiM
MKLLSICVGTPREVQDARRGAVLTSIWKAPVGGPVHLTRLNLAGDAQADLTVHGGVDKAVYGYPSEHYPLWRTELNRSDLEPGCFGENFTTEGMLEDTVWIGDRFRIGSAVLEVSQPRSPCFKLGIRFGDPRMVKRFQQSGRSGFYFRVIEEGTLAAGDAIVPLTRGEGGLSVADINRLWYVDAEDLAGAARAAALSTLADSWRDAFVERVAASAEPGRESAS